MSGANSLSDKQLLLYSRQIMLPQIDVDGQEKLLQSKVLILGMGGLGCPALLYLTACGIGQIQIVDHDVIELHNLQRQILFTAADVGKKKVDIAKTRTETLQTDSKIIATDYLPDNTQLQAIIQQADLVLDGTDNFSARYLHNRLCVETKTPLISGAVIRFEGQVTSFLNKANTDPCYHCLYPNGEDEELRCSENGVLGPVAGLVAGMMTTEAIKILLNTGKSLNGRIVLIDALDMELRSVQYHKNPACPICNK